MKKQILYSTSFVVSTYCSSVFGQQKPNVVLILADDMRCTTMEFLDKEQCHTPVLNQLSQESMVFTNAHIMGGTSGAVSMPSRGMLMTGKYLYKLENKGATIPESHTLMGEVFKNAGYQTFHTGKWHNGKKAFNRCFQSGDDIFFGGMGDHWNVPLFHYDKKGEYRNTRKIINNMAFNNKPDTLMGEYAYSGKHSVDIFTDAAIRFIESQKEQEKPFFLSLCYMSPHDPRTMPDKFIQMYDSTKILLPENYMQEHPFDNGEMKIRDEVLARIPRVEDEVKRHIAEYYAMISHLDERIGDVLLALKECGSYENTIVIFAADNGLAVGQHGLLGKQNVYEHSVRIPLMIKMEGNNMMREDYDQMCYLTDLFPTLCDYINEPIPSSVDGVSLMSVIRDHKQVRDYLYYAYRDCQRGVSDGEWKLIEYNVKGERTFQLFNLKQDPYEINNLIDNKKLQKKVKELKVKMLQLRDETNDNSSFWKE